MTHAVAPPWHFSAEMPTTQQRTALSSDGSRDWLDDVGVCSWLGGCWQQGFFFADGVLQHAAAGAFFAQHEGVSDGDKSEWAQPQPLALHFASEPQQHAWRPFVAVLASTG